MAFSENATVVMVHGAWADDSSWRAIVRPLEDLGLNVIATPIPLTSLSDDAAALKRTIAPTQGPVIVAGHAYAGAVIATANEERVKALVYVAALAPDEGETVAQVFYRGETHPKAPQPDQKAAAERRIVRIFSEPFCSKCFEALFSLHHTMQASGLSQTKISIMIWRL
jgi:pimeloyl-ACP methyl ester carboxylesterase